MIAFDFAYYRPSCIEEAVQLFGQLEKQGKQPIYYGGGTEIISFARMNQLYTEAVIDIKGIPDCNTFVFKGNNLEIGSAITLTQISEANNFPMLAQTVKRIADHTIQGKVTVGGNITSRIIYREAVLPLLLAECQLVIAGSDGQKTVSLGKMFNEILHLKKGELIVKMMVDQSYLSLPYTHVKRVRHEKIDYPIFTVVAMQKDKQIRFAVSGLCGFPFRLPELEVILNDKIIPLEKRLKSIVKKLPAAIITDPLASAEYREFVFKNTLGDMMAKLEGAV